MEQLEIRRAQIQKGCQKWRRKEDTIMHDMVNQLPLDDNIKQTLKKSSILKMTSAYFKIKHVEKNLGCTLDSSSGIFPLVNVLDGIQMVIDSNGTVIQVSEQIRDILGYHAHDLLGENIQDFVHQDDQKDFMRKVRYMAKEFHSSKKETSHMFYCTVRFKYRIAAKSNKTKQIGYFAMEMRGVLKKITGLTCLKWVLLVSCYPVCLVPQMELKHYEEGFLIKFDKDFQPVCLPEQLLEYFGYNLVPFMDPTIYYNYGWGPERHEKYLHIGQNVFRARGSLESSTSSITADGIMYTWMERYFSVTGSKGEILYILALLLVLRKEYVSVKNWPKGKLFIDWGHYFAVPGEEKIELDDVTEELAALEISPRDGDIPVCLACKASEGHGSHLREKLCCSEEDFTKEMLLSHMASGHCETPRETAESPDINGTSSGTIFSAGAPSDDSLPKNPHVSLNTDMSIQLPGSHIWQMNDFNQASHTNYSSHSDTISSSRNIVQAGDTQEMDSTDSMDFGTATENQNYIAFDNLEGNSNLITDEFMRDISIITNESSPLNEDILFDNYPGNLTETFDQIMHSTGDLIYSPNHMRNIDDEVAAEFVDFLSDQGQGNHKLSSPNDLSMISLENSCSSLSDYTESQDIQQNPLTHITGDLVINPLQIAQEWLEPGEVLSPTFSASQFKDFEQALPPSNEFSFSGSVSNEISAATQQPIPCADLSSELIDFITDPQYTCSAL